MMLAKAKTMAAVPNDGKFGVWDGIYRSCRGLSADSPLDYIETMIISTFLVATRFFDKKLFERLFQRLDRGQAAAGLSGDL